MAPRTLRSQTPFAELKVTIATHKKHGGRFQTCLAELYVENNIKRVEVCVAYLSSLVSSEDETCVIFTTASSIVT